MTDSQRDGDLVLETLMLVAREVAPEIPPELISRIYSLQRNHQYDAEGDRDHSIQELQRALEEHLSDQGGTGGSA